MTDTRRHQRLDVELQGALASDLDNDFTDMVMANLSLGGCFIKTPMPEPAGSMVMLRFALPGEGHKTVIKAVGRVCWTKSGSDGPAGMGIQFVRVEAQEMTELRKYIGGLLHGDLVATEPPSDEKAA